MVVEREVVRWNVGDGERVLARPVRGAQTRCRLKKVGGVGLAGPVAFERGFEFASRTDPRDAESADRKREK